jgi:DNA-binding MarR family transcriptional regulator
MLGILVLEDKNVTVSSLVDQLGMLQPTVSMSVAALEEDGYVGRRPVATSDRGTSIMLTDAGKARANEMVQRINAIVVHRKPRSKK